MVDMRVKNEGEGEGTMQSGLGTFQYKTSGRRTIFSISSEQTLTINFFNTSEV